MYCQQPSTFVHCHVFYKEQSRSGFEGSRNLIANGPDKLSRLLTWCALDRPNVRASNRNNVTTQGASTAPILSWSQPQIQLLCI